MSSPVVSIACIAYNHENFISKALESFINQKTDFAFEIVIHDDASEDKTGEIIRDYSIRFPELLIPIFQTTNQYSKGINPAIKFVVPKCRGKYIAICEGDDYWIDSNKLQKQVDFLEENQEYGLTCSDYDLLSQDSGLIINNYLEKKYHLIEEKDITILDYLDNRQHIITLTVVLRRNIYEKYFNEIPENIISNKAVGDVPLWLYILGNYKVRYLPFATGVYRVSENTASRLTDIESRHFFQMTVYNIFDYFITRYNLGKQVKKKFKINKLLIKMNYHAMKNETYHTLICFLRLIRLCKLNKNMFIYLLISVRNK